MSEKDLWWIKNYLDEGSQVVFGFQFNQQVTYYACMGEIFIFVRLFIQQTWIDKNWTNRQDKKESSLKNKKWKNGKKEERGRIRRNEGQNHIMSC